MHTLKDLNGYEIDHPAQNDEYADPVLNDVGGAEWAHLDRPEEVCQEKEDLWEKLQVDYHISDLIPLLLDNDLHTFASKHGQLIIF